MQHFPAIKKIESSKWLVSLLIAFPVTHFLNQVLFSTKKNLQIKELCATLLPNLKLRHMSIRVFLCKELTKKAYTVEKKFNPLFR